MKKTSLHTKVKFQDKNYTIIGIDSYSLKNILDQKKTWVSYTLEDSNNEKTWISGPFNGYYYQWFLLEKENFTSLAKEAIENSELTGIANITFEGNQGFSTPYAEVVWLDLLNNKFTCIAVERFITLDAGKINPLEPNYNAGKIVKDFPIK